VTEPIDETPAGRLMEGILASMHQFDNDSKAARSKAGMRAATERGRWVWKAPLGYRIGSKREPSLVPVPELAPVIAATWPAILDDGDTVPDVLRRLQLAGVRGRGGKPLGVSSLHAMLRAPVYAGRIESARLGVSEAGDWQPLVDEATFASVRARLARVPGAVGPIRLRPREHADFPLRRFVSCGACGRGLTGSWSRGRSKTYGYYSCATGCEGGRVKKTELEAAFLDFLDARRPSPGWAAAFRRVALEAVRAARAERSAMRQAIDRRADRERGRLKALDEAFIFEKAIDRDTYAARRREALEALGNAERELAGVAAETLDVEALLSLAEVCLMQGSRLWTAAATVGDRIRLQWAIFPNGLQWRDGAIWNRVSDRVFYQLSEIAADGSGMVAHPGATWNRIRCWLSPWVAFADSGGAALVNQLRLRRFLPCRSSHFRSSTVGSSRTPATPSATPSIRLANTTAPPSIRRSARSPRGVRRITRRASSTAACGRPGF
jgi:hypothetical protein